MGKKRALHFAICAYSAKQALYFLLPNQKAPIVGFVLFIPKRKVQILRLIFSWQSAKRALWKMVSLPIFDPYKMKGNFSNTSL